MEKKIILASTEELRNFIEQTRKIDGLSTKVINLRKKALEELNNRGELCIILK